MTSPGRIVELARQACSGEVPPSGDLVSADAVLGFSFGTYLSPDGRHVVCPGPVNDALAGLISGHEVLRSKPLFLQEEVAQAVARQDKGLSNQVVSIPTIDWRRPGKPRTTVDVINLARPGLVAQQLGSLAVVAFRHHMPRAEAHVRSAGFETIVPDVRQTGDFDPASQWPFIRNRSSWLRRELPAIAYFALRGDLA